MWRCIYAVYQAMYPFAEDFCRVKTKKTMIVCLFPVGAAMVYGACNPWNVWNGILMLWAVLFLTAELLGMIFSREENRMYEEISRMLIQIRHQYYCFGNVTDAVYFAAEGLGKAVRLHLQEIYRVLTARDVQLAEAAYRESVSNRIYRMLLLQLRMVAEHGDEEWEEGSVFLNNLLYLRRETERSKRNRRQLTYLCSGLGMICVIPVLCMNWIEGWAIGNLPELQGFYHGWQGNLVKTGGLLLSAAAYLLLLYVRWVPHKSKEEEVQGFYFLIRLLRRIPGMSAQELLIHMEENALVFQRQLRRCMREMEWNDGNAFLQMKEETDYFPMQRLADLFAMTEEAGVQEAFAELEAEMQEFAENRQLKEAISQSRQVELGTIVACIPGLFLMIFYLIGPFLVECFRQLEEYMQSLYVGI